MLHWISLVKLRFYRCILTQSIFQTDLKAWEEHNHYRWGWRWSVRPCSFGKTVLPVVLQPPELSEPQSRASGAGLGSSAFLGGRETSTSLMYGRAAFRWVQWGTDGQPAATCSCRRGTSVVLPKLGGLWVKVYIFSSWTGGSCRSRDHPPWQCLPWDFWASIWAHSLTNGQQSLENKVCIYKSRSTKCHHRENVTTCYIWFKRVAEAL